MPPFSFSLLLRRLRGSDRYAECLRVLAALGGIVLYGLASDHVGQVIPLMLGAIACALAETEDRWRSRLGTLLLTLACFAAAAFGFERLMPSPWLLALVLPLASFALVMLGAISGRYATIAGATLVLAIYTMLAVDSLDAAGASVQGLPWQLLAGALWYGVLSLLWSALSPQQAVRQALARLFDALGDYLDAKAALFPPLRGRDREALRLALATRNEQVVQALNETRLVLVDRIGSGRPRGATARRLRLYLIAQDIHERASSAMRSYDALASALFHSDVLFRCEDLLRRQAEQCRQLAQSQRLELDKHQPHAGRTALADVGSALRSLKQRGKLPADLWLALQALRDNLAGLQTLLELRDRSAVPEEDEYDPLRDPSPKTLGDAWRRVRGELHPGAFRFRHAVRLSAALLAGYALMHLLHPGNGYWILLTTVFVCQPSYSATRRRLLERVGGTAAGLLLGWAALRLLPAGPWQWSLVALSGVLFFATRLRRYGIATAMATVLVLLCFNQLGHGYAVIWPRLLDTVLGALLAAAALRWVLPDWRRPRLRTTLAQTLLADADYLQQILAQYRHGKRDDQTYRLARRHAHNADVALSTLSASLLREPGAARKDESLLRLLASAHTLLGHLSALGAHRRQLGDAGEQAAVEPLAQQAVEALRRLAAQLRDDATTDASPPAPAEPAPSAHPLGALAQEQLRQIILQVGELARLSQQLPAQL